MKRRVSSRNLHHFTFSPKYRRAILNPEIWRTVAAAIRHICQLRKITIIALATDEAKPDHVHLFVDLPNTLSPAKAIGAIKWYSSLATRREHPELRQRVHSQHLWQRRYWNGTVGSQSKTVQKYIERQAAG
jgi:putative transposase